MLKGLLFVQQQLVVYSDLFTVMEVRCERHGGGGSACRRLLLSLVER